MQTGAGEPVDIGHPCIVAFTEKALVCWMPSNSSRKDRLLYASVLPHIKSKFQLTYTKTVTTRQEYDELRLNGYGEKLTESERRKLMSQQELERLDALQEQEKERQEMIKQQAGMKITEAAVSGGFHSIQPEMTLRARSTLESFKQTPPLMSSLARWNRLEFDLDSDPKGVVHLDATCIKSIKLIHDLVLPIDYTKAGVYLISMLSSDSPSAKEAEPESDESGETEKVDVEAPSNIVTGQISWFPAGTKPKVKMTYAAINSYVTRIFGRQAFNAIYDDGKELHVGDLLEHLDDDTIEFIKKQEFWTSASAPKETITAHPESPTKGSNESPSPVKSVRSLREAFDKTSSVPKLTVSVAENSVRESFVSASESPVKDSPARNAVVSIFSDEENARDSFVSVQETLVGDVEPGASLLDEADAPKEPIRASSLCVEKTTAETVMEMLEEILSNDLPSLLASNKADQVEINVPLVAPEPLVVEPVVEKHVDQVEQVPEIEAEAAFEIVIPTTEQAEEDIDQVPAPPVPAEVTEIIPQQAIVDVKIDEPAIVEQEEESPIDQAENQVELAQEPAVSIKANSIKNRRTAFEPAGNTIRRPLSPVFKSRSVRNFVATFESTVLHHANQPDAVVTKKAEKSLGESAPLPPSIAFIEKENPDLSTTANDEPKSVLITSE